tara:strand:+ start:402 stop:650 length:249 start_codon:yes stop_codon:yes gene_type:complete
MTTIIRNYKEDELLPDENKEVSYTYEELDGALFLESDDITGAETFLLTTGGVAVLQSIDLDEVKPYEDKVLRTTSLPKEYTR